jgi:site-specific DNA-adenine methylase
MAKLSQLSRGMMTSISEKLVSFYAKVSWEYEKCAKALREVSME